jgi:hypothetical protein
MLLPRRHPRLNCTFPLRNLLLLELLSFFQKTKQLLRVIFFLLRHCDLENQLVAAPKCRAVGHAGRGTITCSRCIGKARFQDCADPLLNLIKLILACESMQGNVQQSMCSETALIGKR